MQLLWQASRRRLVLFPTHKLSSSSTQSSSSSHDLAIRAGVGIPLGGIPLLSIAWAVWERRKRHQAIQMSTSTQEPMKHGHRTIGVELPQPPNRGTGYAELDWEEVQYRGRHECKSILAFVTCKHLRIFVFAGPIFVRIYSKLPKHYQ